MWGEEGEGAGVGSGEGEGEGVCVRGEEGEGAGVCGGEGVGSEEGEWGGRGEGRGGQVWRVGRERGVGACGGRERRAGVESGEREGEGRVWREGEGGGCVCGGRERGQVWGVHGSSKSMLFLSIRTSLDSEEKYQRERLIVQLAQVDTEGFVVMKKALKFKASIKKLQKDRRFVSIHAAQLTENKDSFLASLEKFDQSNKLLSKLVRSQQLHSTSVGHLTEHRDLLGQKLMESECNNHLLREKLEEQHELAMHSQSLHDEIGEKEGRIQSMGVRLRVCHK